MARETGVVKWFSNEKGYGFIHRSSGDDVFVHHSDIDGQGFRSLRQGETVEFEVRNAAKGPRACEVRTTEDDSRRNGNGTQRGRTDTDPSKRGDARAGGRSGPEASSEGGLKNLATQIREKLSRRFGGFGR